MGRSIEELEARVRELEAELSRLRHAAGFTLAASGGAGLGSGSPAALAQSGSVLGVEEMILTVGGDRRIAYLNGAMARLLGASDRREVSGLALEAVDRSALGENFFSGIVDGARSAKESWVVERECPGLDPALLPRPPKARPQTAPILRIVAAARGGSVTLVAQDITEIRWLERNFARCVSPEVLLRMYQTAEADFLKPERKEISVLFCDLRGFTRLCSAVSPEEVHEAVNTYLAQMVSAVEKLGGTVDKFVGDAVMALFGAPLPQPDHALRALLCAADMQARVVEWARSRALAGRAALELGVGVATGPVVAGNVGAPQRLEYTALGHTVNLASRLCGDARAGEILTVPSTHSAALTALKLGAAPLTPIPHLKFEALGLRQFKNVPDAVEVIRAYQA
jgi:class 3 adenylate cyclase